MSPIFRGFPSGWPQLFQHQFRGPFPQKDPSLLIQTKSQLDVISDGKETLDMMWKHVVCTEELNRDLLRTAGATPILISFPSLVFQRRGLLKESWRERLFPLGSVPVSNRETWMGNHSR